MDTGKFVIYRTDVVERKSISYNNFNKKHWVVYFITLYKMFGDGL